jgi:CRISPR system Cascade subunit CasB
MEQPTALPREERSLGLIVGAVVTSIDRVLSPGDVAALRRLRPGDADCAVFWKLLATHLTDELPAGGPARDEAERRWAVILQALARMRGLHAPGLRLGRTLASAGLAEPRVLRMLRARHDALADAARVTAQFLANGAIPTDHAEIAALILSDGRTDEDSVRRRIARDFYAQMEKESRS